MASYSRPGGEVLPLHLKVILVDLNSQLDKIFERNDKWKKVSDIVSQLNLSGFVEVIDKPVRRFDKESMLKLLIYRRIKGIYTYRNLMRKLSKKDIMKLGFYLDDHNKFMIPAKRTFNDFIRTLGEVRFAIEYLVEEILKKAVHNKCILDIELVEKAKKKKKIELKKETKGLRKAVKLIKRLIYPEISFNINPNAVFSTKDLLDVLVHIAQTHDFTNNGANTYRLLYKDRKTPSGGTMMYHFNKLESIENTTELFQKIFDLIFTFASKQYALLRKQSHTIAIDSHMIPYYGERDMDYVVGGKPEKGTAFFFEFVTCSIVIAGRRFVIDAVPKHEIDKMEDIIDKLLTRAKKKIRIKLALLDRGFNASEIVKVITKHKVNFIMPKVKSDRVLEWFDKSEDCPARIIPNFQLSKDDPDSTVNLFLVDDKDGLKRAFITNFDLNPAIAHYLYKLYSMRWGIETSYRNLDHDFQPKTTSKNYNIRLFYFLFSVILYNLWVLVNICVGLSQTGRVPEKPIITAKIFALVLHRVYIDVG